MASAYKLKRQVTKGLHTAITKAPLDKPIDELADECADIAEGAFRTWLKAQTGRVADTLPMIRYVADPGDPHYSYKPDREMAQRVIDTLLREMEQF